MSEHNKVTHDELGAHPDARAALCKLVADAERQRATHVVALSLTPMEDGTEVWTFHAGGDDKHKEWAERLARVLIAIAQDPEGFSKKVASLIDEGT